MKIQTVESIDTLATGLIRRSPNIRLLTLFRKARLSESVSFIGDFILISHLLDLMYKCRGVEVNRWGVRKTINESKELSTFNKLDKTETLEELLRIQKLSIAQMKGVKNIN